MRPLVESRAPLSVKPKIEERDSAGFGGRMVVTGPSQKLGEKNDNNRIYPESVFSKNLGTGSKFSRLMT